MGLKVARVVPLHTIAITASTLVSQITLLLAFLLPLKVIILLGSASIPSYFPDFLGRLERDTLIASLAASAICFYLVHVLFDRINEQLVADGAQRIMDGTRKFPLFENQTAKALKAYLQYSHGLAALVFLALGFITLAVIYPIVAIVLGSFCTLSFISAMLRYELSENFRTSVFQSVPAHTRTSSDLAFLTVFLFIVGDYLFGTPPSILFGLISLILVRQWTQRATTLITNCANLLVQRVQVSALFFHAQTAELAVTNSQPELWQTLSKFRQSSGFDDLLEVAELPNIQIEGSHWLQTGIPGIVALQLDYQADDPSESGQLLVKLFNKQRHNYAQRESTLFGLPLAEKLPAPQLLGVTSVSGLQCHIHKMRSLNEIPVKKRLAYSGAFRCCLSAIQLPPDFLDRHYRSHPGLWLRLNDQLIERLTIVSNSSEERDLLVWLRQALPIIQELLESMPASLVNIEATKQSIRLDANERPFSYHWGRWSVEPLGSTWPYAPSEIDVLSDHYDHLIEQRPSLQDTSLADVKFTALAFEFERLYTRETYTECFVILKRMKQLFSEISHPEQATPIPSRAALAS